MSLRQSIPVDESSRAVTRRQLLDAARQIFAEAGFRNARVREICRRAGANIAAVNYHFGGKAELYTAALADSLGSAIEKYPPHFGLSAHPTPQERLSAFVRSFLLRVLSEGPHAQHGKLMSRELVDPSPALDHIVSENIRPLADTLMSIVRGLLGPAASPDQLRRCAISVVSQIVFYHHCRPVLNRLFPEIKQGEADIERLAEHITEFSLAAMKILAGKKRKKP